MNSAMYWVELIAAILGGLAVCIPVVARLVVAVQTAVKEKNWPQIVNLVLQFMQDAEGMFAEGEARKAWVMREVEIAAKNVNYDYDDDAKRKVSDMIDAICKAAKVVNGEGKTDAAD